MRKFSAPTLKRILALSIVPVFIVTSLLAYLPIRQVSAAIVDNRQVDMYSQEPSVNTTHLFEFEVMTATSLGSIEFEYCVEDPFPGEPCTGPTGLDVSAASLDNQTGEVGFSLHGNTTANRIVLTRVASVPAPGVVEYDFSNIDNPDTPGPYYIRIGTFATTDGTGPRTDEGGLAFYITDAIDLSAFVPPILIFCLGTTIVGNDCTSASGNSVDFGTLSANNTRTATTQMAAATNGVGGYTISVTGNTMTSGNNTIPALSSQSGASSGNARFGLNLVNNSSPNVGSNPTGVGTGVVTNDYNDVNLFKFTSGDAVASSALSTDFNKYTSSYIVDIDDDQVPGVYTTTLTYIALATF